MKEINLTHGFVAIVDDDDFQKLTQYKWLCSVRGYAERTQRYGIRKENKKVTIKMHRFILGVTDPQIKVDHINGNKLDNRRQNLRLCTQKQNAWNRSISKNNTSGFIGVIFDKRPLKKPWIAQINLGGKHKKLGYFETKEEAAQKYNEAAIQAFGEFAKLNKIGA